MSPTLRVTILILSLSALLNVINATVQDSALQSSNSNGKAGSSNVAGATETDMTSSSHHKASAYDESSMGQNDAESQVDGIADTAEGSAKRAMSMLRLGRAGSRQSSDNRRAMSALRLGRRSGWKPRVIESSDETESTSETEKDKRKSMSMLRLGRGHENQESAQVNEEEKKAMSALRLGRKRRTKNGNQTDQQDSDQVAMTSQDSDDNENDDDVKRAMGMLRLGRNFDNDEDDLENILTAANDDEKRAMGMLRLGRQPVNSPSRIDRRKSMSMLRLG